MSVKHFDLSKKIVGAGMLAVSLAVMPLNLPASAQTGAAPNQTNVEDNSRPTLDTTPFQETKNDNNNWGWLGLIGLIGLANLFRKPART
jgi:hypothetical protein